MLELDVLGLLEVPVPIQQFLELAIKRGVNGVVPELRPELVLQAITCGAVPALHHDHSLLALEMGVEALAGQSLFPIL